ncbi:hypothetical protein FYJ43_06370 [Cutibacterium sp. WCA-380-WT-3A]|uniref:Uncharacterized protein n=1 Tax=Cutibacterium porci TaxID=2605781 RepID=A0A7K0J6W6_9ACTN|nr:hypothetical protein [Cutibacterium porci]
MPQEATDYSTSPTISPHVDDDLRMVDVHLSEFVAVLGLWRCHGIVSAGPWWVVRKSGRRR